MWIDKPSQKWSNPLLLHARVPSYLTINGDVGSRAFCVGVRVVECDWVTKCGGFCLDSKWLIQEWRKCLG